MNESSVSIFFIESYFHLLVADQIIKSKKLSIETCFFITERGTQLPLSYYNHLIYDGSKTGILTRVKLYYKNKALWSRLFAKQEITVFLPFQYYFPSKLYFAKYCFFEEGFSAYANRSLPREKLSRKAGIIKELISGITLPFATKNIKGIVSGITNDTNKPCQSTIFRLSDYAYKGLNGIENIDLETITIDNSKPFSKSDIYDSLVVVLDRLSANGRPFDDKKYLDILYSTLHQTYNYNKKMFVKMHPADYKSECESKRVLDKLACFSPELINENLENLAICNNSNTFIGTNSTILYYAPILGNSNKSISFARLLAKEDAHYSAFLNAWGGVEEFCKIFSNQVKCL